MASARILIVDDEQPLARVLAYSFQNEGYRVQVANNGIDCMNKVATFAPDVIIMDIMMPKLDGVETIRLLRQNQLQGDTLILVLSAKSSAADRETALAAGADLFLAKPFQIARVLSDVEALLSSANRH